MYDISKPVLWLGQRYPDVGNTVTCRWIEYLVQFDVQGLCQKKIIVQ